MYFWNIRKLADQLHNGTLTEAKSFNYFFAATVVSSLSFCLPQLTGVKTPLKQLAYGPVFPVLWLLIIVVGLLVCFQLFQRLNGQNLIQRIVCLAWPASIRAFVFCLPLYIVAIIIARFYPKELQRDVFVLSNACIIAVMFAVQFFIIYRYLGRSLQSESEPEPAV